MRAAYDRVKQRELGDSKEWKQMKEFLVKNAVNVCGNRYERGGIRKGSEWWNYRVRRKVEEINKAYRRMVAAWQVEGV